MKIPARIAMSVLVFCVIAGGGAYGWFIWKPAHENAQAVIGIQQKVQDVLKDPDSAKFRGVRFYPKSGAGCGEVNAKNSMGGYIGFSSFVAPKNGPVQFEPTGDESIGEPKQRIEVLNQKIAYLDLMSKNCPEVQRP